MNQRGRRFKKGVGEDENLANYLLWWENVI